MSVQVWMLSMNREYSTKEYETAFQLIQRYFPNERMKYEPRNADSFRQLMTCLLPVLMMRFRRIPRSKWVDHVTQHGKHWIAHAPSAAQPDVQPPAIGYHLTFNNSLSGMAITHGLPHQVVTIGLGIKQLKVDPRGITVPAFIESLSHKLTRGELVNIGNNPDEIRLRRICMLLALKEAYLKAIGQPMGFDYSRLEFDVPNSRVTADGKPVVGWEFRIFGAKLGVARGTKLMQEEYQCVCALFLGSRDSTFVFHDNPQMLGSWVTFLNIDQVMATSDKLAQAL